MGWKNWPYWVRGGLIGGLIAVVLDLIILSSGILFLNDLNANNLSGYQRFVLYFIIIPMGLISFPLLMILVPLFGYGEAITAGYFFLPFVSIVSFFIIGAIIGLVYGKIKKRKMKNAN